MDGFILKFGCYFRVGKTKKRAAMKHQTLSVYIHMHHEASVNLTQCCGTDASSQNSYI